MNPDRVGLWRKSGVKIGMVYQLRREDLGRIGNCWLAGRLRVRDLAVALRHSGDCFYDYQLIEGGRTKPGEEVVQYVGDKKVLSYNVCHGGIFSAYALGRPYEEQPTRAELEALLSRGEHTPFSRKIDVAQAIKHAATATQRELLQSVSRAVRSMKKEQEAG